MSWRIRGIVIALAVVLCGMVVGAFLYFRSDQPPITAERLSAAEQLWQSSGPADYDIQVRTNGPRAALYAVEVREGVAVSAAIDGRPIEAVHAIDTWSVPGMFDTIQSDLQSQEIVAAGEADRFTPRVTIWGEFHPELGYPRSYRRAQKGGAFEAGFVVTKFEIVE